MKGGGFVEDATLAANEAAATYVAHRIGAVLHVHESLTIAEKGLAANHEYGTDVAKEKLAEAKHILDSIGQRKRQGYVFVEGRQSEIDKVISPELADFLDKTILANVPSDPFAYKDLQSRITRITHELSTREVSRR